MARRSGSSDGHPRAVFPVVCRRVASVERHACQGPALSPSARRSTIACMSWWGRHPSNPIATRAEVRRILPVAACTHCVYSFRIMWDFAETSIPGYAAYCCPRCGLEWGPALTRLAAAMRERSVNPSAENPDATPESN